VITWDVFRAGEHCCRVRTAMLLLLLLLLLGGVAMTTSHVSE